jgi:hypothetical protein
MVLGGVVTPLEDMLDSKSYMQLTLADITVYRDLSLAQIGLTRLRPSAQRQAAGRTYNPFLTAFTTYDPSKCI